MAGLLTIFGQVVTESQTCNYHSAYGTLINMNIDNRKMNINLSRQGAHRCIFFSPEQSISIRESWILGSHLSLGHASHYFFLVKMPLLSQIQLIPISALSPITESGMASLYKSADKFFFTCFSKNSKKNFFGGGWSGGSGGLRETQVFFFTPKDVGHTQSCHSENIVEKNNL